MRGLSFLALRKSKGARARLPIECPSCGGGAPMAHHRPLLTKLLEHREARAGRPAGERAASGGICEGISNPLTR